MFKKYSIQTFLKLLVATTIIEIVRHFMFGYSLEHWAFIDILILMLPIRILLIVLIFVQIIRSIVSQRHEWKYVVLGLLLICISMVPKQHYSTFGEITRMHNSNPTSVLVESRNLMDIYEPMTHFGTVHRTPLNNPRSLDEVPQMIKTVHKGEVLVLENAVLLESWGGGFEPSFQGFVVFREGFDPWINEKQIMLDDFWYSSWRIRIIDGLYWYKVNGYNNPFLERIQLERSHKIENSSE